MLEMFFIVSYAIMAFNIAMMCNDKKVNNMAKKVRVKRDSNGRIKSVEHLSEKDIENEGCGSLILFVLIILAILYFILYRRIKNKFFSQKVITLLIYRNR